MKSMLQHLIQQNGDNDGRDGQRQRQLQLQRIKRHSCHQPSVVVVFVIVVITTSLYNNIYASISFIYSSSSSSSSPSLSSSATSSILSSSVPSSAPSSPSPSPSPSPSSSSSSPPPSSSSATSEKRWKCQDWNPAMWDTSSSSSSSPPQSPPPPPPQLLGILLVGKADIYTIDHWLRRHIALFEKLVVIDGSNSTNVQRLLEQDYNNNKHHGGSSNETTSIITRISDGSLNLTAKEISDQTLRGPAMRILGNPVGCYLMICHPDEFWVLDPRQVVARISYIDWQRQRQNFQNSTKHDMNNNTLSFGRDDDDQNQLLQPHNVLRVSVLTASPFESEYFDMVQKLQNGTIAVAGTEEANTKNNITNYERGEESVFSIMSVSKYTHPKNSTVNKGYMENRFVLWEDGMRWGTRHSLVVPEHMPNGMRQAKLRDVFMVHFKVHDFSPDAIGWKKSHGKQTSTFQNSRLRTGLHAEQDGWKGSFLDLSAPEKIAQFPPVPLKEVIEKDRCHHPWLPEKKLNCTVPWSIDAAFT